MKPNIVVLTDFSPASERARAYAAVLAAPLGAELHLVHVFLPSPTATEYGMVLPYVDEGYVQETRRSLQRVADAMPVSTTVELIETSWYDAVEQVVHQHRPLLLVAGLTATHGQLDEWLSNRALPLAHRTGFPLLLVPEHLLDAALHLPKRLALAVEDRAFRLAPAATAVAPLLDILGLDIVTVSVLPPEDEPAGGWHGLRAAQRCGLAAAMPASRLHTVIGDLPAAGILQAATELSADMVGLLDLGHGWVHKLFNGSIIDYVLRHAQVPVLLLSAKITAPEE